MLQEEEVTRATRDQFSEVGITSVIASFSEAGNCSDFFQSWNCPVGESYLTCQNVENEFGRGLGGHGTRNPGSPSLLSSHPQNSLLSRALCCNIVWARRPSFL
ncbi:hypothetical protein Nmel_001661 [Mimus melanotis]